MRLTNRRPESCVQRGAKVFRNRRLKKMPFAGSRVRETEFPGVQHLPRCGNFFPIKRITDHGMTEVVQVHANLVRATTVNRAFHQADSAA